MRLKNEAARNAADMGGKIGLGGKVGYVFIGISIGGIL